jgi:hypothetical protein
MRRPAIRQIPCSSTASLGARSCRRSSSSRPVPPRARAHGGGSRRAHAAFSTLRGLGRERRDGGRRAARGATPGPQPAHPPPARGPHRPDAAAPRLAKHPRHAGAGLDRAHRDLVGIEARHRRARRHGAGVSGLHDDADAFRRRCGRRHLVCDRPGARGRTPRRCRRARAPRASHQWRPRPPVLGRGGRLRPAVLHGARRGGWLARGGARLLERGVRRHLARVAHERFRERDPRHRQHARAVARSVHWGGAPRAPVAAPHLRHRPDPGPRAWPARASLSS